MEIPEKLKFNYLLALDSHIESVGKENKEATMKKIFEITKEIADLGYSEDDILAIAKDEDLYICNENYSKHQTWMEGALQSSNIYSQPPIFPKNLGRTLRHYQRDYLCNS